MNSLSRNLRLLPSAGLIVSVLALSACSSQPAMPELPSPAEPDAWQSLTPGNVDNQAEAPLASLEGWWLHWNDPVLNQLISYVLINNPSLNSAGISYRLALLQAGVATSSYRPRGSATLGASESGNENSQNTSFSAGLSASWELDLWGTRRAQRDKAEAAVARSLDELRAAQVSLIAEVVQAYVDLRSAQQSRVLAQESIAIRQQSYDLARWQRQAGLSTELQQAQALTLLKQTEATLPSHEQSEKQALQTLQALAGGDLSDLLDALNTQQDLPALTERVVQLPADVLRQRPDVQAREKAIREQNEAIVLARHARYPSFALSGSISSSSQSISDLFDADAMVARIAANLSYLLFDGGVLKQSIRMQELQLEQSLLSYRSALLTAQKEVEGALTRLDSTQRQQSSYEQALASAELSAELALMQFDAGLLSFTDLLDAQSSLVSSRSSILNNRAGILSSWIQLYRSMGGGWQGLDLPPMAQTTAGESGE